VPAAPLTRWSRIVRPQDLVWILLFFLLAVTSEERDA